MQIAGQCAPRFAAVRDAFEANFAAGREVGASFAATLDGEFVVDLWGGYAYAARSRPCERDTVVNVFGPVTLKHGVNVLSSKVEATYGEKTTAKGTKMRECSVLVTWTIMGPLGDTLTLQTMGEALDTADKATTKAQSVALRTLLLGFGLTPTHDKDPDADRIERGNDAPARSAESYRDEILDKKTSPGRLQQISYELTNLRMLGTKVVNETGEQETLDSLGRRIYGERTGGGQ